MANKHSIFEAKLMRFMTFEVMERAGTPGAADSMLFDALSVVVSTLMTAKMAESGYITKPEMRAYLDGRAHEALDRTYTEVVDHCTNLEKVFASSESMTPAELAERMKEYVKGRAEGQS